MDQKASEGDAAGTLLQECLQEAVRALSDQRLEIDGIHSRTSLLLSVAAVATSFLGARALEGGSFAPHVLVGAR